MHGVFDAHDYLIFKKRGGAGGRFLKASVTHAEQDYLPHSTEPGDNIGQF